MELTTTGISGLDAQLGGGVPRGTTILLIAEPGNAASVFAEQFTGGGLDAGENAIFLEFDRPTAGLRNHILAYVHNVQKKGEFRIYDGYSGQFGKAEIPKEDTGFVFPADRMEAMSLALKEAQQQVKGTPYRLVFESLSTIASGDREAQTLDFIKRLVFLGHQLGGVHLITLVKGLHSPLFENQLKHLVGGVLELGTERKGFGIYSYLLVSKMMNLPDPVRLLLFKETDKGLWLESTKRVF